MYQLLYFTRYIAYFTDLV